jgi:hypothetical protein
MNRIFAALLLAPALLAGCTERTAEAAVDTRLDAVRAANERFRDVNVALAEGYVPAPGNMCESAEHMGQPARLGAMGVHFFRPDLLGITTGEPRVNGTGIHTDFLQPAILLYEPQADGSMELVGVENLVFKAAWEAAGFSSPPSFMGIEYDAMADDPSTPIDEAHMFEPHYDLHIWLYRDNPNGTFAQFNPNVTCRYGVTPDAAHAH